ncbi:class I SAM-dependent methyltransferase [Sphingoaurantiacus capsulatus]|uniref:Class I SAM-dependent methyltransferase n=1 Tax=Sphingoaurantiacus capsulatus TaxID=1771310 RepID=A0ABV7XCY2_9SPHN
MDIDVRYTDGQYLAQTGNWHEDDARWKARHILSLIGGAGLAPHSVVDIGCGTGGVLANLQSMMSQEVEFTGYEIAAPAFAVAEARSNPHLRFINGSALEDDAAPLYDLAIVMDVFEHVPDYLGFIAGIRRLAKAFVFHVPLDISIRSLINEWPMEARRTVGHIHYFTTPTAKATIAESGYRIDRAFHTHAIMHPPPQGWKMKLRRWPHKLLFSYNTDLCAKVLGGCSLMVLATPVADEG